MNYSKKQLHEMAQGFFKSENVGVIYATSDGQFFVKESFQKRHADEKKLAKYTFNEGEDFEEEKSENTTIPALPVSSVTPMTLKELAEHVKTIGDVAVLGKLKELEAKNGNRTGAMEIINARIWQIDTTKELATITDVAALEARKLDAAKSNRKREVALIEARIAELSNK